MNVILELFSFYVNSTVHKNALSCRFENDRSLVKIGFINEENEIGYDLTPITQHQSNMLNGKLCGCQMGVRMDYCNAKPDYEDCKKAFIASIDSHPEISELIKEFGDLKGI